LTIVFIFFAVISVISWIPSLITSKAQFKLCNTLMPKDIMTAPENEMEEWNDCINHQGYFHNAQKISMLQMYLFIFFAVVFWRIDNLKNKKD